MGIRHCQQGIVSSLEEPGFVVDVQLIPHMHPEAA
jgi:hypothetical protein